MVCITGNCERTCGNYIAVLIRCSVERAASVERACTCIDAVTCNRYITTLRSITSSSGVTIDNGDTIECCSTVVNGISTNAQVTNFGYGSNKITCAVNN